MTRGRLPMVVSLPCNVTVVTHMERPCGMTVVRTGHELVRRFGNDWAVWQEW